MDITLDEFHKMLVVAGHLTEEQFSEVVAEAEKKSCSISEQIFSEGLISDKDLGLTIADFFDCHFTDLSEKNIDDSPLEYLPEIVARAQRAVVIGVSDTTLNLATEKIKNYEFFRLLEKKTGKVLSVSYASARGIDQALKLYKGNLYDRISALISACAENQEEADVVKLVDFLLDYANDSHASDIHIEPLEKDILVRFRVDGLLHEVVRYPKTLHEKIVFRIKIMAHMQTDEHAAAQDGRFEFCPEDSNTFDVRVSILPVTDGENVVMRLLDIHTQRHSLENLGLSEVSYNKILTASERPHGMIVAVGPTGSGKTTVLYTILEKINAPEVNIMTIEDPVEYDIQGVQQTQVNQKKGLTFANGLRSIVRQDPDVIMVGEIRDEETADIAINSALTGHLVISTLHANDTATAFPRLIEMNVEPFLIASSINLIVSVRLVRKICSHCKESYLPTAPELEVLKRKNNVVDYIYSINKGGSLEQLRLYRGKGCKMCRESGYAGRVGIFEVLEVDEKIRILITKKESASVIHQSAQADGMVPLLYDGIAKALSGITTIEEVIKVAGV